MSDVVFLAIALGTCSTGVGFLAGLVLGAVLMGKPDVLREMDRMEKDL